MPSDYPNPDDQFNTEPLAGLMVPRGITLSALFSIADDPDYFTSASPSTVTMGAILTKLATEAGTPNKCPKCRRNDHTGDTLAIVSSGQVFQYSDHDMMVAGTNPIITCDLCGGWGATIEEMYFHETKRVYGYDTTVGEGGEAVTTFNPVGSTNIGGKDDPVLYPPE